MTQTMTILTDKELTQTNTDEEAQGFGSLATERGHLPLQALDIQATLEDLTAQTDVSQTFVNTYDQPLEATYIFPLPDRAAVTRFRLDVAGRVVEGQLQERGQARAAYNQAIAQGHRAAIAEEERSNVFTLRVGNIPPGESARVRLTLTGPLEFVDGEVTFRFPLVVAPKYIPGNPLDGNSVGAGSDTDAVPDASRISPPMLLPGYPNPVQLSLRVDVLPSTLITSDFRCSLHSVFMQSDEMGRHRFELQPCERLNRDFVLRYRIVQESIQTSLSLIPDETGTKGTLMLTVVPPETNSLEQRPRDIIFVVDRSGSMSGWKMVAARKALAHMVDSLTDKDRFNVYAFDNRLETLPFAEPGQLLPANNRNRHRAVEHLHTINARGGTDMAFPLKTAAQHLQGDRDRILVLITDGQVGNEDQILHTLTHELQGTRIFTLGIDQAVNQGFLRRLAALGGGSCDVVESEQRLDEVMYKVHRRIGSPVLSDLRLEATGMDIDWQSLQPTGKRDLLAGTPLTILGRYDNASEGSVQLIAEDEAGQPWSQTLTARKSYQPAASVLWARRQIRDLEDKNVSRVASPSLLEKQIVEVSLQFRVLSRFTAYVAIDKVETVNEGGEQHKVIQPVEQPAGWQMLGAESKQDVMGKRAARKSMLAKQVLSEMEVGGRVSNKTMIAFDAAAKEAEEMPPPAAEACDAAPVAEPEPRPCFSAPPPPPPPVPKQPMPNNAPNQSRRSRPVDKAKSESKKSGGWFSKLRGMMGSNKDREERKEKRVVQSPDAYSAYRQRVDELIQLLKAGSQSDTQDRIRRLGILKVKLAELIADLRSIDPPKKVLDALEKLLLKLSVILKEQEPKKAEVEWLRNLALKTLEEFSTQG